MWKAPSPGPSLKLGKLSGLVFLQAVCAPKSRAGVEGRAEGNEQLHEVKASQSRSGKVSVGSKERPCSSFVVFHNTTLTFCHARTVFIDSLLGIGDWMLSDYNAPKSKMSSERSKN